MRRGIAVAPGLDRNIDKFDDAKRGLAKLMARENINVQIIDGVPTATFDTVERVLTLPNWPNLSVDQLDLLIGHEVSHALNTDHTFIERLAQKKGGRARLMSYFNVVEDARIERKIRESYPGMNSVFYNGYRDFTTQGPLFQRVNEHTILVDGVKEDVRKLNLIDRINLHYKVGAFFTIPFAKDELKWLDLIDACYSTENAFDIAEGLYAFAKEKEQQQQQGGSGKPEKSKDKQKSQQKSQQSQGGDDSDDSEESDGKSKSKGKSKDKDGDKDKDEQKSKGKGKGGDEGDDEESDSQDDTDGDSADHDDDGNGDSDSDGEDEADSDGDEGDDASGDDDDSDGDDSDADGEENGDDKDAGDQCDNSRKADGEPSGSKTDEALTKALQKLVEQQQNNPASTIKHLLLKPLPQDEVVKRTLPAVEWMERSEAILARNHAAADLTGSLDKLHSAWSSKYMPTVRHMVSEFQRKKQAALMQKAKIARTGRLDVNRLHSYKFADDLFKRSMVVPNGQSHGIVLMIDGSGSMNGVFGHVLDQVLLFAHFAFTCNIPFEAYMFSDLTQGRDSQLSDRSLGPQTIVPPSNGRLIGLINTNTDRSTFRRQVRMVLAARGAFLNDTKIQTPFKANVLPYMQLNGTPLYAGMMVMERHVERMKRVNKLDKMMAVVISDGGDTNGLHYQTHDVNQFTGRVFERMRTVGDSAFVVRDTVTKRNHMYITKVGNQYACTDNAQLTMLFDVMKERHDCRSTFMFLSDSFGPYLEPILRRAGELPKISATEMQKQLAENEQFIVPNGVADCSMVLQTGALHLKEDAFAKKNTSGMSSSELGEAFIDAQKEAQKGRVFTNNVMPYLV